MWLGFRFPFAGRPHGLSVDSVSSSFAVRFCQAGAPTDRAVENMIGDAAIGTA